MSHTIDDIRKQKGYGILPLRYIKRYLVIYHFAFYETDSFQLELYATSHGRNGKLINPSDEKIETAIEKHLKEVAEGNFGLEQGYEVYTDIVFELEIEGIEGRGLPTANRKDVYVSIDQQPLSSLRLAAIIEDES